MQEQIHTCFVIYKPKNECNKRKFLTLSVIMACSEMLCPRSWSPYNPEVRKIREKKKKVLTTLLTPIENHASEIKSKY